MKPIKISLIVLTLIAILLMSNTPASAKITRFDFYGGWDEGTGYGEITHILLSGPNAHLAGINGVHCSSYDMEGNVFSYNTGWARGTDVHLQLVDGNAIWVTKISFYPDVNDGGWWEGTLTETPAHAQVAYIGKGTYQGMYMWVENHPDGSYDGYIITKQ